MKFEQYLYQKFLYYLEVSFSELNSLYFYQRILVYTLLIFWLGNFRESIAINYEQEQLSSANFKLEYNLLSDTKEILFLGNIFFSAEMLKKELLGLKDSGFMEPSLLLNDLTTLYKNCGFLNVRINFEEKDNEIVFHIMEGSRAKINDVKIAGTIKPDFSKIVKNILSEKELLDNFEMKKFDSLLSRVKERLSTYGYWDFDFKSYKLILNKDCYDLLLEVDQGPKKLLKRVVIDNDSELDINLNDINLPVFDAAIPFDINLINKYKDRILEALPSDSELLIKHDIVLDEHSKQRNCFMLVFKLEQKSVVYFGDIIINGCSRTLPDIIMQNLTFKTGDIWDFDKIEQSLKKLKDLKIFKSISIVPTDFFQDNARKTTVINVVEDSMFEASARLGFAQVSETSINQSIGYFPGLTYKFGGSFLWKNVSGMADSFRLDFNSTRFSNDFAAVYKTPINLMSLPMNLSSKIFKTQIGQSIPGLKENFGQNTYIEDHSGLKFNLDYDVNKFNVFFSTALDFIKVSSLNPSLFNRLQLDSEFFKNSMPCLILEPGIILNTFDNEVDPIKGFRTALTFKAMLPLNNISGSFLKLLFEHSQVVPLTINSCFAFKFRAGYIFNKNFETILPTERFYLGGFNSIRSYEPDMVPSVNSLYLENMQLSAPGAMLSSVMTQKSFFGAPTGAKFMVNLNTEWRCRLYDKLSGVIFNDIGLLNRNKLSEISFKDIVGATGFGLQYATPLGPIRFDVGFKWKRQREEKPFNWYLTFGQSF